ncbi:lysophosphatidic acid phosphatase type 6 isoform X2 [Nematostella vectensis]|uniref:lysophosphatidic acid phosphatase type 6 isoform X2 n=1 Tax=Nematostella vectensis TaxID=45351 RepID=UPI002076F68C|nr:lysophosphatidic acid phosphatase type 6 isoform X2 [Nematostella vectensis]
MAARWKLVCNIGGLTLGTLCTVQAFRKIQSSRFTTFASEKCSYELVHAQIAFRHGARTPVYRLPEMVGRGKGIDDVTWDKDVIMGDLPQTMIEFRVRNIDGGNQPEYSPNIKKGGCICGELTKVGQQQTFDLGRTLQKRYVDDIKLLSPVFTPHEVYIRSTNVPRTIKSAKCVVAGLYGKENIQRVLHIITRDEREDTILPNMSFCPLLTRWLRKIQASSIQKINLEGYAKDHSTIRNDLGITAKNFFFVCFRDVMSAREAHGLFVDPILHEYWDMIDQHATEELVVVQCGNLGKRFARQDIIKASVGKFLDEIVTRMNDKINGISPAQHKMCLYSVHDTSISCLLTALGVFDNKWPDFASEVAFELYRNQDNKYFVKVLYQGKAQHLPGNNTDLCPFEKFKALLAPQMTNDWQSQCIYEDKDSETIIKIGGDV